MKNRDGEIQTHKSFAQADCKKLVMEVIAVRISVRQSVKQAGRSSKFRPVPSVTWDWLYMCLFDAVLVHMNFVRD